MNLCSIYKYLFLMPSRRTVGCRWTPPPRLSPHASPSLLGTARLRQPPWKTTVSRCLDSGHHGAPGQARGLNSCLCACAGGSARSPSTMEGGTHVASSQGVSSPSHLHISYLGCESQAWTAPCERREMVGCGWLTCQGRWRRVRTPPVVSCTQASGVQVAGVTLSKVTV